MSASLEVMPSVSIHPPKRLLYGPGPTQVHPRVYDAMTRPIVGHLDPYFFQVTQEVQLGLRTVYGTKNDMTFAISSTGSGGMEACISNFVQPGVKTLVFVKGFFGERMWEMSKRQGANVVRVDKAWGQAFTDEEVREAILREKPDVVQYVMAETSTGVYQDGRAMCEAAHEVGAIVISDCVTSFGAMPVNVDATGIDVAFACSQKGLSCPPGLSPITISDRAEKRLRNRKECRTWYFDFALLLDYYLESHRYHHTAPITMFYAIHQGLALVEEEGLENRLERHHKAHLQLVRGLEEMGLAMWVDPNHRIWNLNTVKVPQGINDLEVRQYLIKHYGIEISGGFGPLAGQIFRIGIMGPFGNPQGVEYFLECFREAMAECGYRA